MKQYKELLTAIKDGGTYKPAARENMPGTQSLFGCQFRHNLADGFPLLTTKKMFWKGIVIELLWFLKGDTNIKFLVDNGVNIWNEDAYNYYHKKCKELSVQPVLNFNEFISCVESSHETCEQPLLVSGYKYGDCGFQYGKVWRSWDGNSFMDQNGSRVMIEGNFVKRFHTKIDQIKNLIDGLKKSPESRRHIVTSWDPAHDQDLALTWCHAMFQMNCRPLTVEQRKKLVWEMDENTFTKENQHDDLDAMDIPKYFLDCQLYQRSADVFLGVPFNIASYALLTEILAKICNMVPGEVIFSYGDIHIYDNHMAAVEEQLKREPGPLPKIALSNAVSWDNLIDDVDGVLRLFMWNEIIQLREYDPQPAIKAELSTGIKK